MGLLTELSAYVEAITGRTPGFVITPLNSTNLPLYLAQGYDIHEATIFGHKLRLALYKPEATPEISALVKDWHNLAEFLGADIALVLPHLRSYERKRLVEKHIPFIVPRRQMFLPMFLVDLREYFPFPDRQKPARAGWVAQVIVIRHLLHGDMENRPLSAVAETLGYSAMAVTQSVDQLQVLDLCRTVSMGRTRTIRFDTPRRVLWEQASPHLRSPVKKRYFARWIEQVNEPWLRSGLSALADLTSLAPEPKEVWAVGNRAVRKMLAEGRITTCPDLEEADGLLEGWTYRPELLSSRGTVDRFSLYLSLRGEQDDRIQRALESLMERFL